MRVLLDTCTILDAMQCRGKFASHAQLLLIATAEEKFEGCVSAKQICDLFYILHKVYHDDSKCRESLDDIFNIVEVVDVSASAVINARISPLGDYEDAVLAECAKEADCQLIASSNPADFKKSSVKTLNPAQACKYLDLEI